MKKRLLWAALLVILFCVPIYAAVNGSIQPQVIEKVAQKAKDNTDWKRAYVTGRHEQIVFMNISRQTNPKNEIGMETHPFDQVILIVEGKGKAVLNGKTSFVEEGDLIFIPKGAKHNVVNLSSDKPLKIISFYSDTDIPKGSVYKTKADEQND